jgi:ABC-2 type transport system permease protein
MLSIRSIWALTLRYFILFLRDTNLKLSTFCWPLLDIVLWGFLGIWIQSMQVDGSTNYQAVILLCIVLWQVTVRSTQFIFKCLLEELWTRNLVNIFSLPISLSEWIASIILYTAMMTLITLLFCMIIISLFYNISFWYLFYVVSLFAPPLFISGTWLGFTCLQALAYFGKRSDEIGWILSWILAPFTAAFYPLDILPAWAQTVSRCLPMSYAIDGMRRYLTTYEDPTTYLIKAYLLSILYATVAILIFAWIFHHTKQKGLVRLFN